MHLQLWEGTTNMSSIFMRNTGLPVRLSVRFLGVWFRWAGYFSLELVYDPKAPPGYTSGGPFQYLGLSIDSTLATIAYKVDAAVRRRS